MRGERRQEERGELCLLPRERDGAAPSIPPTRRLFSPARDRYLAAASSWTCDVMPDLLGCEYTNLTEIFADQVPP